MDKGKELSRIARFVSDRVEELRGIRNQREIADMAGYSNQNMITMIKQGYTKVALDRVVPLAKALDADPNHLMRIALEQFYSPSTIRDFEYTFGAVISKNERRLLEIVRTAADGKDVELTDELEAKVRELFQ